MQDNNIEVLLIEDNPGDARLIQEMLSESKNFDIGLTINERLSDGIKYIQKEAVDILLLDLCLPDSIGLFTYTSIQEIFPLLPIVILTSNDDQELAYQAVKKGAQDYLIKNKIEQELLIRSLRYAIERQRLKLEVDKFRQEEEEKKELSALLQIAKRTQTNSTAEAFGLYPLRESAPDIFQSCIDEYSKIVELSLEQQVFRVDHNISVRLNTLGDFLGNLKAIPRDVIDIHTASLRSLLGSGNTQKEVAIIGESRLLVLELMGYLVLFYRNYYV